MQNHNGRCDVPRLAVLLTVAALAVSCKISPEAASTERRAIYTSAAVKAPGYLAPDERPDGIALVPPPPVPGSAEAQADEAVYREVSALEGTARWELAAADANLKFPRAANTFACALGFDVDASRMPHLYTLLQRTIIDAGQSTYPAKQKYMRRRPFEDTGEPTCLPDDEKVLRGSASYPSGHASLGYVWGEVLAEVVPKRATELRARAREFGQSRVICRVHWQTDVDQGHVVGRAVFEKLHSNADFLADLQAAKREARAARQRGGPQGRDCAQEASAATALPLK